MKQDYLKSFVQRNRTLSPTQKQLLEKYQHIIITDPQNLPKFTPDKIINLEIGFGKGDFLTRTSCDYLDEMFIGCDPYITGTINVLRRMDKDNLKNILLFQNDVRLLTEYLQEEIFDKVFILFPDPWPKMRHHKRRIINQYLFDELKRTIKTSGKIYIITDSDDYAISINQLVESNRDHFISYNIKDDSIANIETYYHTRALARKHNIHKIILQKL